MINKHKISKMAIIVMNSLYILKFKSSQYDTY